MGKGDEGRHKPRERSLSPRGSRKRYSRSKSSSRSSSSSRESKSSSPEPRSPSHRFECKSKTSCIIVFGLREQAKQSDLRDMFMSFGNILHASVVMNPRTRRSRGYGFVRFGNSQDAERAKEHWDGAVSGRKKIQVRYALANQARGGTSGGKGKY